MDRTISFIPPDGEFELMSYRLNTHVSLLIFNNIVLCLGSWHYAINDQIFIPGETAHLDRVSY